MSVIGRLDGILARYQEIERELSEPGAHQDHVALRRLGREQSRLRPLIEKHEALVAARRDEAAARYLLDGEADRDMVEYLKSEMQGQRELADQLEAELRLMLLPQDPNDDRSVIVEIRAGTGGEEATLFAADLFRMYQRNAERKRWHVDVVDYTESAAGGFHQIVFEVQGPGAYSRLKFESGVHRVQRVPETESQGRVHTSAASVAVFPEPEDVDVEVREEDLKVEVYRSSGHGGQSVNTTDSAVRMTHLPTGLVVTCQDERSQLKNRSKALTELRARLYDRMLTEQQEQISKNRRSQVQRGDRSEKIRTYNFPQDRVTDHRIGLTPHNLPGFMNGDIDQFVDNLIAVDQAEKRQ